MSPVSTCWLVQMSLQNFTLIIIRTFSLFLPTALGHEEFKQAEPNAQRANSQLLTLRLCWRGLALSDSSWSQLIRTCRAEPVSFFENMCTHSGLKERFVYLCIYACIRVYSSLVR